MTTTTETHEGVLVNVQAANGRNIGHTTRCTCGWESGELRGLTHQALAILDHLQHLTSTRPEATT